MAHRSILSSPTSTTELEEEVTLEIGSTKEDDAGGDTGP
jgi:hypothetical protein